MDLTTLFDKIIFSKSVWLCFLQLKDVHSLYTGMVFLGLEKCLKRNRFPIS